MRIFKREVFSLLQLSYDGTTLVPIFPNAWTILITQQFLEDGHTIPNRFKKAYHNYYTNSYVYARTSIVLFVRLWHWWSSHRWIIEHIARYWRLILVNPGEHYSYYRFNWNWRWYNVRCVTINGYTQITLID